MFFVHMTPDAHRIEMTLVFLTWVSSSGVLGTVLLLRSGKDQRKEFGDLSSLWLFPFRFLMELFEGFC